MISNCVLLTGLIRSSVRLKSIQYEFVSESSHYVVGEKRFKDCEQQGMLNIINKEECEAACDALGIPIDKLKENRICFKAGNGKCRQQNQGSATTSRICKKEGTLQTYNMYTFKN